MIIPLSAPWPLGVFEMYTGPAAKGAFPVFITSTDPGEEGVTTGVYVADVVYEYSRP